MRWLIYLNLIFCTLYAEALIGKNLRRAELYEYPFVVSIGKNDPTESPVNNHICTGVLVSDRTVLTGAHCLEGQIIGSIQVIVGDGDLFHGKRYNLATWVTYNDYAKLRFLPPIGVEANMALLVLEKRIAHCFKIRPVSLSPLNIKQIERTDAVVVGFGKTDTDSTSRFALTGKVQVLSHEECNDRMRKYSNLRLKLPDGQFCSKANPHILMDCGDSGGPILNKQNELIGINIGRCPHLATKWYELEGPENVEFLKEHLSNLHASIDFYREFINEGQYYTYRYVG